MGIVSSIGNNTQEVLASLREAKSGISLAEDFVKYLLRSALDHCGEDLQFFDQRIDKGLIARLEAIVAADFELQRPIPIGAASVIKNGALLFFTGEPGGAQAATSASSPRSSRATSAVRATSSSWSTTSTSPAPRPACASSVR